MPQPAAVSAAPDDLIARFVRSQRRIESMQAEALANPLGAHRVRNLRATARVVNAEIAQLRGAAGEWLQNEMPRVYTTGARTASASAGISYVTTAIDRDAIQFLIDDTFENVLERTTLMADDAKRWVRETANRLTGEGFIEGHTPEQLRRRMATMGARAATVDGMPLPITIVYQNGSVHTLDNYADTLFRDKTARAYNTGTINAGDRAGITAYEGADGDECGLTSHDDPQKVNGRIFTADIARSYPVSHPGCRRAWIPRPDLDPSDSESVDVGSFDPSTTATQRADQARTEVEQAARNKRRQARTARNRRASRNKARQEARQAAAQAAEEAARAKQAAKEIATARRRRASARKAQRTKVRKRHGEILDRRGITADQFITARGQISDIKAQLRVDAADLYAQLLGEYNGRQKLARIPRIVRSRDPNTGVMRARRPGAGGEWDFFDELDPDTQAWLRGRMVTKGSRGGLNPDDLPDLYGGKGTIDEREAIERWIEEQTRLDAASQVSQGKDPTFFDIDDLFRGESDLAQQLADEGLDLSVLLDRDAAEAAGAVAENEAALRAARGELFENVTGRPAPWEMSIDDYADELAVFGEDPRVLELFDRIAAGGTPQTDGERYVLDRFAELVPEGFDLDPEDIAGTHEQLVLLARDAGLL